MKDLTARDIMSSNVIWLTEDMSVEDATRLFVEEKISGAPVVDDSSTMTGVVSIRDCLRSGKSTEYLESLDEESSTYYNESWELPLTPDEAAAFHLRYGRELLVKDIMTPVVFNVNVDTPVRDIAATMLKGRVHRLVVLDGEELAGMVTTMDMLKAICYDETRTLT